MEGNLHQDPWSDAKQEGARDCPEGIQAISQMDLVVQQYEALPQPKSLSGVWGDLDLENAVVFIGDSPEHMIREQDPEAAPPMLWMNLEDIRTEKKTNGHTVLDKNIQRRVALTPVLLD